MESPANQKCCFLLFTLAFKTCNKEARTTLSFEYGAAGQNWIPIISNIHGLNTIFHSKNFCIAVCFSPTEFSRGCFDEFAFRSLSFIVAWCASYWLIRSDHCISFFLGQETQIYSCFRDWRLLTILPSCSLLSLEAHEPRFFFPRWWNLDWRGTHIIRA